MIAVAESMEDADLWAGQNEKCTSNNESRFSSKEDMLYMQNEFRECSRRFDLVGTLGQGAYGTVVSALDKNSTSVAIKKMDNCLDRVSLAKRTLREIRILRLLRHENILKFHEIFICGGEEDFEDIYLVTELMETDLYLVLKSPQPLTENHSQFFLYQILRGCKFLHSAGVIHRDLKPKNLLVNSNCDLKICDFGWARVKFGEDEFSGNAMTEYVCTRWYRAPEVLCAWTNYDAMVDIWSTGCIFAELVLRKPLFSGQNTESQLRLIIAALGPPEDKDVEWVTSQKCRKWLLNQKAVQGVGLRAMVTAGSETGLGLLEMMLQFNPRERPSSSKCMEHAYLQELHLAEDEPGRDPLDQAEFGFENFDTIDEMRKEMHEEYLRYQTVDEVNEEAISST